MPWQTPPAFSDTNVLSASQLNILSSDLEYLNGLAGTINFPFNSLKVTNADLTAGNNQWLLKHLHQYFHHKIRVLDGTNGDLDIFMQGAIGVPLVEYPIRIYTDSTSRGVGHTYSNTAIDIEDVTTWLASNGSGDVDIYQGAWLTATAYEQYDIVENGGNYYYHHDNVATSHTSGASTEPGVGADWGDYWHDLGSDVNIWVTGTRYQVYVVTNNTGSLDLVVDYLLESDQSTL